METLAMITSGVAVLALVGLALLYGKYRADARVTEAWRELAETKENNAKSLKNALAEREKQLNTATKAVLSRMPASELAALLRRVYGAPAADSRQPGGSVPPAGKAGPDKP